jgi:3-deoxy-manno-octulosonate cytidylyltransferase (CMP-KDO synthetase)
MKNQKLPVKVYIPARENSTRIPTKLLQIIDNETVIQKTFQRAKFVKAEGLFVVTDSDKIAENIGNSAIVVKKEYLNGTERICDILFHLEPNDCDELIVNIQGDEPYFEPHHINLAIDMFQRSLHDPLLACVFIHTELSLEEAKSPSKPKLILDSNGYVIDGTRNLPNASTFYGRLGIMVYRKSHLKNIHEHPNTPKQLKENLEWLKIIEMGLKIKSVKSPSFIECGINIPSELNMVREKYSKPRVFLIRSGSFSNNFVNQINQLWKLRDGDLVARCKSPTDNNKEIFKSNKIRNKYY